MELWLAVGAISIQVLGVAITVGIYFKRRMNAMRDNEIHGLEQKMELFHTSLCGKIDTIHTEVRDVAKDFKRHVQWHLDKKDD